MSEKELPGAYFAQLRIMYDLKADGAVALANAGVERRKQFFDFLHGDLAPGRNEAQLTNFLNTNDAFKDVNPPRKVSGVVASDGQGIFPLMTGPLSVRSIVDPGLQALGLFIANGANLGDDYTCKQLVWDPKAGKWVWEYNYTMAEMGSDRLSEEQISYRFLQMLATGPNAPGSPELDLLKRIKPNYRLACSLIRDEAVQP